MSAAWAEATDRRVKFMASVLRHIKAIKLSAYEPSILTRALAFRDQEIHNLRNWIRQILVVSITTNVVSNFLGLLTITTYTLVSLYAHGGRGIETSTIFTVISTISLLADPLRALGQQIGNIVSAWASWKRIERFLLSEEREPTIETQIEVHEMEQRPVTIKINGTFGIQDQITLLEGIKIDLVNPSLWMIAGRVGSVSIASR